MAMKRFVLGLRKRIGQSSKKARKKTGICSEARAPVQALIFILVVAMTGCPHDKLHPPRLSNALDVPVTIHVVLVDGTVTGDASELAPGHTLVWGYSPAQIARITVVVNGDTIAEIDSDRIAKMLECTDDPRGITWHIEQNGLRPSVPCR